MDPLQTDHYKTREILVEAETTIGELLADMNLSSAPIMISLNGEVMHPDEARDVRVVGGDKLLIVPLLAGG